MKMVGLMVLNGLVKSMNRHLSKLFSCYQDGELSVSHRGKLMNL